LHELLDIIHAARSKKKRRRGKDQRQQQAAPAPAAAAAASPVRGYVQHDMLRATLQRRELSSI
jgi:hypothetical protein